MRRPTLSTFAVSFALLVAPVACSTPTSGDAPEKHPSGDAPEKRPPTAPNPGEPERSPAPGAPADAPDSGASGEESGTGELRPQTASDRVWPPPPDLGVSPFYTKYIDVSGLPVVSSAKVSDFALLEAAFLIRAVVGPRSELLGAMGKRRIRFVVMAASEMTTDIPEYSTMTPKAYWDRRARGLGATAVRPAVSCGEENLLEFKGDPYSTENILIHELAHAIHDWGLRDIDPTFDQRLVAAYDNAKSTGLWQGTYAMENHHEYWAEGTQSWFDTNRANDSEHGPTDTRVKLKAYDLQLAKLLSEVYGDFVWRYTKPSLRPLAERAHLAGFDPAHAGVFSWPLESSTPGAQMTELAWLGPTEVPAVSPQVDSTATSIVFVNQRSRPVSIAWVDFSGKAVPYLEARPGTSVLQSTYSGHVWRVTEDGKSLGGIVASSSDAWAYIR